MEGEFRKVAARTTDIFQERTLMLVSFVNERLEASILVVQLS